MKKITTLLLLIIAFTSSAQLKLKDLQTAPTGSVYVIATDPITGKATYSLVPSIFPTPTLQQVVTQSYIINDGTFLQSSPDGFYKIDLDEDATGMTIGSTGFGNTINFDVTNTNISGATAITLNAPSVTKNGDEIATTNQLPIITGGTNVTVSGTTPNYTVSSPSQSLSISGNTISLTDNGGSVTIPTQTTGLASTSSPTITSPTFSTSTAYSYATASQSAIFDASKRLVSSGWIDYSATSTIVGWSSFTVKSIFYIDMGAYYLYKYNIVGTSDATSANFTMHVNETTIRSETPIRTANNGTNMFGFSRTTLSSNVVDFFSSAAAAGYTASGTKTVSGTLIIMK